MEVASSSGQLPWKSTVTALCCPRVLHAMSAWPYHVGNTITAATSGSAQGLFLTTARSTGPSTRPYSYSIVGAVSKALKPNTSISLPHVEDHSGLLVCCAKITPIAKPCSENTWTRRLARAQMESSCIG